ncbi:pilus assembly protein TadG-related protein [Ferrimicrobium sp.]|uniref:pilus assembly protein TadG-related protein n=1 Tax=Ferrimicrobium sp. TaxID=2926050 RepID=UPI002634B972|nr:pilus assembly protein TadG-related protein [Ferrimicrobium sp.]
MHRLSMASNDFNDAGGSALILVPVLTLVVVLLITLAINAAALYFDQHQLTQIAEACALQGTRALSPNAYYLHGQLMLSPSLARDDVDSCIAQTTHISTQVNVSFPTPLSLNVTLTQAQKLPLLTILNVDNGTIIASATALATPSGPANISP